MTTNFLVYEKQEAKNIPKYSIKVSCYYGDADGYSHFELVTDDERQLLAYLIELHIVMLVFPSGRGGCRDMFDYRFYFTGCAEASKLCTKDKAFSWFDEIPFDSDCEQTQTIESYFVKVNDPNFQGIVDLDACIAKQIASSMGALNDIYGIGDLNQWDIKYNKIGKKSAEGWLPDVLKLRDDLLKEYDETMKKG